MSRPRFGLPLRFVLLFGGYLVALFAFEWRTATQLEARVIESRTNAWDRVARALPEGALDGHSGQAVDLSATLGTGQSLVELAAGVSALLERDPIPAWLAGEVRSSSGLWSPADSHRISDELLRAARHEHAEGRAQQAVRWACDSLRVLWTSHSRSDGDTVERCQRFSRQLGALLNKSTFAGEPTRLLQAELDPWLETLSGTAWVEAQLVGLVPRRYRTTSPQALFTRSEIARSTLMEWGYVEQLQDALRRPFDGTPRDAWGHVTPAVGDFWRSGLMRLAEVEISSLNLRRQIGMTRITLASRVYELDHGAPPPDLASLAGYLGGEVPLDPATGAPFAVGTTPNGARCIVAPQVGGESSGHHVVEELSAGF